MATVQILNNALALNAQVINKLQNEIKYLKAEASSWKLNGETAFFISTCIDVRKNKAKLAKAVELQRRIKAEVAAIFRAERIKRKYVLVFGKLPFQTAMSFEQEAMLDKLILEKEAEDYLFPATA